MHRARRRSFLTWCCCRELSRLRRLSRWSILPTRPSKHACCDNCSRAPAVTLLSLLRNKGIWAEMLVPQLRHVSSPAAVSTGTPSLLRKVRASAASRFPIQCVVTNTRNQYNEPIQCTKTMNQYNDPIQGISTMNQYNEPIQCTNTMKQ